MQGQITAFIQEIEKVYRVSISFRKHRDEKKGNNFLL